MGIFKKLIKIAQEEDKKAKDGPKSVFFSYRCP